MKRSVYLQGLALMAWLSSGCGGPPAGVPAVARAGSVAVAVRPAASSSSRPALDQVVAIDAPELSQQLLEEDLREWRAASLKEAPRSRRPVTQRTCLFSGSAHLHGFVKLYREVAGTEYDVTLSDVDVVALRLPPRPHERAKLEIDYPFRATGYIDSVEAPVVTASRIDLVRGHAWIAPQTRVRASSGRGGQAQIALAGGDKSRPAVALRVPCERLSLAVGQEPGADETEDEPETEEERELVMLEGVVPLLGAAGGKVIGQLDAQPNIGVRVLERRPGWAHVVSLGAESELGSGPFEFDAWVAERFAPVEEVFSGWGGLGLGRDETPSHVTTGVLPLRLSPDPQAAVVAELVSGVRVLAGGEHNGMCRIRINEAEGHNEGNDFWVTSEDFEKRAVSAPLE